MGKLKFFTGPLSHTKIGGQIKHVLYFAYFQNLPNIFLLIMLNATGLCMLNFHFVKIPHLPSMRWKCTL